jgi:tetratricopeptide (TPR) repeat protein
MNIRKFVGALIVLGLASTPAAADQEALQKVKALYAAAAYEDALAVVASVPADTRIPQLDQYRAFCLIALGQSEQAEDAIQKVLTQDPLYAPDPAETSPRVIDTFEEVRERVLPAVVKKLYLDAKTALERKNRKEAVEGFDTLLRLIETAPASDPTLEDMKVLAEGFRDLSRALPEPAAEPVAPVGATTEAAPSTAPVEPASVSWTRPVPVRQDLPRWVAPDALSRRSEFTGIIRVMVGADGKVQSAEMIRRTHPIYDGQLIRAAQDWLYEPARQNGDPVAAEVLVEVRLRPQE